MIILINVLTLIPALILIFCLPKGYTTTQLINHLVLSNIFITILLAIEPKRTLLKKRFIGLYIIHLSTYIIIDLIFFNTYSPKISISNILLNLVIFNLMFFVLNGLPILFTYSKSKKSKWLYFETLLIP